LTWTTGKPKRPGWYWYRATPTTEPHPVDILKEALKQQKEPGWYRREPITDPYSTKVRIGGAIVVFTASILFLSVFPA